MAWRALARLESDFETRKGSHRARLPISHRSVHLAQARCQSHSPRSARRTFYLGAPLSAFEIVSASETAADLDEKVTEYLANGAAEVWLIYPRKGHAWVYEASGAARLESRSIHTSFLPD